MARALSNARGQGGAHDIAAPRHLENPRRRESGKTLKHIKPTCAAETDMSNMLSGTPGNRVFYVVFTPTDAADYDTVRDIPVTVEDAALPATPFCNALRSHV